MGYRGGYLSGLDFAVDMLGFQPVAHKYQRGDNSIIAYNLDFFFRIVEVHFPTGLQLDDQIAPSSDGAYLDGNLAVPSFQSPVSSFYP